MHVHEKLSVYIEVVLFQVPAVRTYQLLLVFTCVCVCWKSREHTKELLTVVCV